MERCLQTQTGSCTGCNVQALLERRINQDAFTDPNRVAKEVQGDWCPEGTEIQMPKTRRNSVYLGN